MSGPGRRWMVASLRELLRPIVLAYLLIAAGVDAMHIYSYWPGLDVPMHYAGALVLTYVIHRGVGHAVRHELLPPLARVPHAIAVFSLVCTVSLFWELGEFLSDRYLGTGAQGGLDDTMFDMLIDVLGSVSFIVAWSIIRRGWRRTGGNDKAR